MKDRQHYDLAMRELITNLILRDENAPHLPRPEAREPLAEAWLHRYALDAIDDGTHGACRRDWINRLKAAQVRIGRIGPAERHRSATCLAARSSEALHPGTDFRMSNRRASISFRERSHCLAVAFLIESKIPLNRFLDDSASRAFEAFCKTIEPTGRVGLECVRSRPDCAWTNHP